MKPISLLKQVKTMLPTLGLIAVFSSVVLGAIYAIHLYLKIPLKSLIGDINSVAELPVYAGMLSQLGFLFWVSAAAVCFFSARLIQNNEQRKFLLVSGSISLLLCLDDMFLLHEEVIPSIGIQQKFVFLAYVIMMIIYGIAFLKILLTTEYLLFAIAIAFFSVSLCVDNLYSNSTPFVTQIIEDGAKFIGLICWCAYFFRTGIQMIKSSKV